MHGDLYALMTEIGSHHWSGKIFITNPAAGLSWDLYFSMGHLIWVDGGLHPRRRFRRHLKSQGIVLSLTECRTPQTRLQYVISAVRDRRIGCKGLQKFLHKSAREIFFDIGQACSSSLQRNEHGDFSWHKNARPSQDFILPPSWGIDACRVFKKGRQDWQQWSKMKLAHHSPDTSPTIIQKADLLEALPPHSSERILKLFSSKRTLRDIARYAQWQPPKLAAFIRPYLRKGYIALEASPDYGDANSPATFEYLEVNGLEFADMARENGDGQDWTVMSLANADMQETVHEGVRCIGH